MKQKQVKLKWVEERKDFLQKQDVMIFTGFQGLTVKEVTDLRQKLSDFNAKMEVVKNRLFEKAFGGENFSKVSNFFTGPTAVIYSEESVFPEVCKILVDFAKENELFEIRGGYLKPEKVLLSEEVKEIAKIPDKNTLIAMFIGAAQAPIYNFHHILKMLLSRIVFVLKAIGEKKEG